ncbi:unnamed protein product [Caenorhabditis bovis]|uniref:PID domain-containing protein n=1 Tax=Caenorhabditis bovis TaxID=2654633 RepID=A0A8S1ED76_9PELO|nr:unnamed protein product [Caenorhabditis bovis]
MAKDIYKTFKKSISAVTGGNGENVKYRGGTGRTWIHPPDFLINGRVEYTARFLGCVETSKPHGSDVAKEAIHAIRFQLDLKRSEMSRESAKLQKVDIQISIDDVTIADNKTKLVMFQFPLGRISFCADDKDDKRMFSFIARGGEPNAKHSCFAFTSEKLAEEITLTIGEAFDLAYKRFLDKNRSTLENQKQVYILKKRIAELESENQVLSERLAEAIQGHGGGAPPALPQTPMPQSPPASIYSSPRYDAAAAAAAPIEMAPKLPAPTIPPPPLPIAPPPPPIAPRRQPPPPPPAPAADELRGLKIGDDVFDDTFDPRADEPKKVEVPAATSPKTADDFQAMIDTVEKKLAAINTGKTDDFEFLQTGELHGVNGAESEYGTPSDRLNPEVMNLKK